MPLAAPAKTGYSSAQSRVAATGLSTGAHLDYRFMRDGRYVDPLSADLQYLHLRRTTRHGPQDDVASDSRAGRRSEFSSTRG